MAVCNRGGSTQPCKHTITKAMPQSSQALRTILVSAAGVALGTQLPPIARRYQENATIGDT